MKLTNYDVHFNAIRKALRQGNASVMVGAGFSRNAQNGEQLATWAETSSELWRALNPDEPPPAAFSTSVVTQLGEQYARVFSKPALEDVLKRLIPDERVHPGNLHAQLLELPWVEIFTTNYDTLLERAADSIVDRAHYTITCREDIPQSKILNRRRIVKLHGSFPSQRPFIFTEDEYRRYPNDFAPFVNLVRQSLLENVFCLVGFSGDDPNFLHWIGWVRDMLDQHALPIYLLLNRAPSLGQQKLLDARQVTPIVLPQPSDVDEDDYSARLEAFFRAIDPLQDPEEREWGDDLSFSPPTAGPKTDETRRDAIIAAYEVLATHRKSYPGWLIAPGSIRREVKHAMDNCLALADWDLFVSILQEDAFIGVTLLAEYAWYQEFHLQSMSDSLAIEAQNILAATASVTTRLLQARASVLDRLDSAPPKKFRARWKLLALAVLRWAREGLNREAFDHVQELLAAESRDDVQLEDEIAYESVLFSLYEGDLTSALRLLNEWEVKSADGYMQVRKGSLLSELGELDRGFRMSLAGLQQLRRNQRSRSDTKRYLSEEAWACMVISRQQRAKSSRLRSSETSDGSDEIATRLSRRLVELAVKGFDVRRELESLRAALDAESSTPSDLQSIAPSFDIGKYSSVRSLGAPQRLREKIGAAFSWLSLADRVALVPRIAQVNFSVETFLCAGWWIQYADSMQRVLSVLIRTMSTNALGSRQSSDSNHTAGWLSRFQVGRTDESLAIRICDTSLSLVENVLDGSSSSEKERTLSFHIQVFGRLVIRISSPEIVESYAKRMISMHEKDALNGYAFLWGHFSTALVRCFESLSTARQKLMLPSIWKISSKNPSARQHLTDRWIPLHLFNRRPAVLTELSDDTAFVTDTEELLQELETSDSSNESIAPTIRRIWEYAYLMESWAVLSEPQKKEFCQVLWSRSDGWPTIKGFNPDATYIWGPPAGIDHHQKFREWILERLVPAFPEGGSVIATPSGGSRAWGFPVDHSVMDALNSSFRKECWPASDVRDALVKIKAWWLQDWPQISVDIDRVDDLRDELADRLDGIDEFLASIASDESLRPLLQEDDIASWIAEMMTASMQQGHELRRYRIVTSLLHHDNDSLWRIARELMEELGDSDISVTVRSASQVVEYWLTNDAANTSPAFNFVVTSIAAFVAARRMPALPRLLYILTAVVTERPNLFDSQALAFTEIGLSKMQEELRYQDRRDGSGIPDDNVPLIRFHCARLALALRDKLQQGSDFIIAWIESAQNDPLPEMRFLVQDQC